ncbi:MAG: hypothetical protein ABI237_10770 [Ginsengibacter sp.]
MRDTMLMLHFIGLAMGLGTSFAHAFLGKTISKMERSEAKKFKHQIMALSQMGYVGIFLLITSGIYLIVPYWSAITTYPLLIIKLILVFILVFLIVLIGKGARKDYKSDTEENSKRIGLMGKFTLIIGITIIILAINIFH